MDIKLSWRDAGGNCGQLGAVAVWHCRGWVAGEAAHHAGESLVLQVPAKRAHREVKPPVCDLLSVASGKGEMLKGPAPCSWE